MRHLLLDVDPNSVRAGWLPLGLVVLIGVVIALLYLSMRHEMKKIDVPTQAEVAEQDGDDVAEDVGQHTAA